MPARSSRRRHFKRIHRLEDLPKTAQAKERMFVAWIEELRHRAARGGATAVTELAFP